MTAKEFQKHRMALGLKPAELAEQLGVSRVSVTRYENGTIKPIPESRQKALRNLVALKKGRGAA